MDDIKFKIFDFDEDRYLFDIEDFEIFKIENKQKTSSILKKIATAKKENREQSTEDFRDESLSLLSKDNIFIISVDLAHGCTLNCKYCYLSAAENKKRLLTEGIFIDILNFFSDHKKQPLIFYFAGGGEPTLNFELIKKIPQLCTERGFDKCHFELTTNGTLLTQEMITFFKHHHFTIDISLDGDEESNADRIFINGTPSFDKVYRNIQLLQENNIRFSCKPVIKPDNNNLLSVFDFFERSKIPFVFGFATESFDGHYIPSYNNNIFGREFKKVCAYYQKIIESGDKIYASKILEDLKRIHYGVINKNGCIAAKEGIYVDMQGDIYSCSCHNSSKELSIGSIYKGIDYEKIVKEGHYPKNVNEYEACRSCWMKYLCSGSCIAFKWIETKNTGIPSSYICKMNDAYWKCIIELYISVYPIIKAGNNPNFNVRKMKLTNNTFIANGSK